MRFQVLSSTIRYSDSNIFNRKRIALEFSVHPTGIGELKFSDGSRLMGCDIADRWGSPLTIGVLSQKLKRLGYKDIDESKFWPLSTSVHITCEDWRTSFLKDEEIGCGYVGYSNNDYLHGLQFWLSVDKDIFCDFLRARMDLGGQMTFDIKVRGLADDRWTDPGSISGTWDLNDTSDCGKGDFRVVTEFSLERSTHHFYDNSQIQQIKENAAEAKEESEKTRELVTKILEIANGTKDGLVSKLLFFHLIAVCAIAMIGFLILVKLFF